MGLFEKKYCDLCGDKVNALTRQKLSDGYLCSDCKHKLSSLSSGWKNRTLADVKAILNSVNRTGRNIRHLFSRQVPVQTKSLL